MVLEMIQQTNGENAAFREHSQAYEPMCGFVDFTILHKIWKLLKFSQKGNFSGTYIFTVNSQLREKIVAKMHSSEPKSSHDHVVILIVGRQLEEKLIFISARRLHHF